MAALYTFAWNTHLHVRLLPCLCLPGHLRLMSSRSCPDEFVKGSLLLTELQDLPQSAVADVRKGHYKQFYILSLRSCKPEATSESILVIQPELMQ